jgi:hypothetical protein
MAYREIRLLWIGVRISSIMRAVKFPAKPKTVFASGLRGLILLGWYELGKIVISFCHQVDEARDSFYNIFL